ncbi:MAG: methionyl-tRNA formyltransferase [Candidatus Hydrogenedentota bacterium]|nr:MAG: methionyl-tRNA formyltransferase [Candidatus Hydrogenedentota bacterium]
MRILFLGTPAFAVPTLKRLVQTRHEIIAVLTQPDRPRGRGLEFAASPVKTLATQLGLAVMQPEEASSPPPLKKILGLAPDVAVIVAYGQILKRDFLDLPRLGCINLHPSLLPRYRGPTPIQSAILAGETTTGVTTMLLDEGMDTGDILLQREMEITHDDTAGTLHDKLAEAGADLMIETLEAVETGVVVPYPQDESSATVTRKLNKKDATIDWSQPPGKVCDLTRAMDPWPGCQTLLQGKMLKVWKAKPCLMKAKRGEPGQVVTDERGNLIVHTGSGAVRILELQLPGGRRMSAEDFTRGHTIKEGTVLGK